MSIEPMPMPWEKDSSLATEVAQVVAARLASTRPSPKELIEHVEATLGPKARWYITEALRQIANQPSTASDVRVFVAGMINSPEHAVALIGAKGRDQDARSEIDELIRQGWDYRGTQQFQEMIQFLAKFTDYSPFNNLLVWTQRPGSRLFATRSRWAKKFGRRVVEDARPMVILAPRTPVLLVYDIDQTEGPPLPEELDEFATFEGTWEPTWLERLVENAARHYSIRVNFRTLTSTLAGFATIDRDLEGSKMRIVVHDDLDAPSRFGVLCHELAHVLLGHLGSDHDRWWPNRYGIDRHSIEVEAEASAYITTRRLGLRGASARYVSRHMIRGELPEAVSPDHIAKVAGRLEEMATGTLPARSPGKSGGRQGGRGIG